MSNCRRRSIPEPKSDVLRQQRVARRLLNVRRLVDDHRRIAGAHAIGRRARTVGSAHHGCPPVAMTRSARAMSPATRRLGMVMHCRMSAGAPSVSRPRASGAPFRMGLLRARMRREHHDVAGLDRVDRVARRREVRIGRGDDAGDDASRLAVFDDPLFGISSMTPTLFCRSASRSTPRIFIRLFMRLSKSPRPLSSMPSSTSR